MHKFTIVLFSIFLGGTAIMLWLNVPRYVWHRQCLADVRYRAGHQEKFSLDCKKHYSEVFARELREAEIPDLVEACMSDAVAACMSSHGYHMSPIDSCTETTTGVEDFWCWNNDSQL